MGIIPGDLASDGEQAATLYEEKISPTYKEKYLVYDVLHFCAIKCELARQRMSNEEERPCER